MRRTRAGAWQFDLTFDALIQGTPAPRQLSAPPPGTCRSLSFSRAAKYLRVQREETRTEGRAVRASGGIPRVHEAHPGARTARRHDGSAVFPGKVPMGGRGVAMGNVVRWLSARFRSRACITGMQRAWTGWRR